MRPISMVTVTGFFVLPLAGYSLGRSTFQYLVLMLCMALLGVTAIRPGLPSGHVRKADS